MNRIFSEHVRSLADGTGDVDVHLFDAAWEKLGDALQSEMRKRGIWSASPSYLGLVGYGSWTQEDAFFELQSDCYEFNFVRRLPGLRGLLDQQDNIEGVVFRNIGFFLFDLQEEYDPVGYRAFCTASVAANQLVDDERLVSSTRPRSVSNDSILAFPSVSEMWPVPYDRLADEVEPWGPNLLPDVLAKSGKRFDEVVQVVSRQILGLRAQGLDCFRFTDLARSLKDSVRRSWNATWRHSEREWAFEDGDDDGSVLVPWISPDGEFEAREQFRFLKRCVADAIEGLDCRRKTRTYLAILWDFMCDVAVEAYTDESPRSGRRTPSKRFLAEHLEIPRDRLPGLLQQLGELMQDCLGPVH